MGTISKLFVVTAKSMGPYMDYSLVTDNASLAWEAYQALCNMPGAYRSIVFIGNTRLNQET
jgi:hypothetical protein